jgi:hypothetical protein
MRKFLVKHFVLDYFFTVLGKRYNAPRASRVIYPLMLLCGWFTATNYDFPTPNIGLWILYILLVLSLFFGFVYFRIYPAKWDELDNLQKLQYGFFMKHKMTVGQLKEWKIIRDENNR